MKNIFEFTIDNNSPMINYGTQSEWTSAFAETIQDDVKHGYSARVTRQGGASLSIHWKGTGVSLAGQAETATYTVKLDGKTADSTSTSDGLLFALYDLENTDHVIELTTATTLQSPIRFEEAIIVASSTELDNDNSRFTNHALEASRITFSGQWGIQTLKPSNRSFFHSSKAGDSLQASFEGVALFVKGLTSPSGGGYSVTLDNIETSLSAKSLFSTPDSLLFYASGLGNTEKHVLEIQNSDGGDLFIDISGLTAVHSGRNSTYSESRQLASVSHKSHHQKALLGSIIIAIVLAALLSILLIIGGSVSIIYYRRRVMRLRQELGRLREDYLSREGVGPETLPGGVENSLEGVGRASSGFNAGHRDSEKHNSHQLPNEHLRDRESNYQTSSRSLSPMAFSSSNHEKESTGYPEKFLAAKTVGREDLAFEEYYGAKDKKNLPPPFLPARCSSPFHVDFWKTLGQSRRASQDDPTADSQLQKNSSSGATKQEVGPKEHWPTSSNNDGFRSTFRLTPPAPFQGPNWASSSLDSELTSSNPSLDRKSTTYPLSEVSDFRRISKESRTSGASSAAQSGIIRSGSVMTNTFGDCVSPHPDSSPSEDHLPIPLFPNVPTIFTQPSIDSLLSNATVRPEPRAVAGPPKSRSPSLNLTFSEIRFREGDETSRQTSLEDLTPMDHREIPFIDQKVLETSLSGSPPSLPVNEQCDRSLASQTVGPEVHPSSRDLRPSTSRP